MDRTDVRLDVKTNHHLLDIKFRHPIVADRIAKSRKKSGDCTVYEGKHDKQVSAKSYQKSAADPKKSNISVYKSMVYKFIFWKYERYHRVV